MQTPQVYPIRALKDNYIWVIVDDQDVFVVDPGESLPVLDFLAKNDLTLKGILITHGHWDHVNGIDGLLRDHDVWVVGSHRSTLQTVTRRLKEGDVLDLNDHLSPFQVIEIPGHTLDHLAFYTPGALFCGDTLFGGGCGRLFEGTGEMLYASLQKLLLLPPETGVYCAHEYTLLNLKFALHVEPENLLVQERLLKTQALYERHLPSLPSSLAVERQTNPFLRCDDPQLKKAVERFVGKTLPTPEAVFVALRCWKDSF